MQKDYFAGVLISNIQSLIVGTVRHCTVQFYAASGEITAVASNLSSYQLRRKSFYHFVFEQFCILFAQRLNEPIFKVNTVLETY